MRYSILALGNPDAQYRVFVTKEKGERLYQFRKNDSHVVTEELLERQLRESQWAATGKYDPSERQPR